MGHLGNGQATGNDRLRARLDRNREAALADRKATKKPKRASSRFPKFNEFMDKHAHNLPPVEIAVWCYLWREERNGAVEVSHQQVADTLGVSRSTAIRAIKALSESKYLRRIRKGDARSHRPNKYTLELPS